MSLSEYKLVGTVPPTYCSDPMETMEVWAVDSVGKTHIAAQFKIKYVDTVYCCNSDEWRLSKQFGTNFDSCECMEVYNGKLYAGTANNAGLTGYATVWSYDDYTDVWTKLQTIGNCHTVESAKVYDSKIYFGTGDTVGYASIVSYSPTAGWNLHKIYASPITRINALETYDGNLYIGNYSTTQNVATVDKFDGTTFITSTQVPIDFLGCKCLKADANYLYAGFWNSANLTTVAKFSTAAGVWSYAGNNAFATAPTVRSLEIHDGKLYAGLGSNDGDAELWMLNPTTNLWEKIHDFGTGFYRVESLKSLGTKLYIGLGNTTGCGRVYSWNGTSIVLEHQFNPTTIEQVECLQTYNSRLYAGLGRDSNSSAVWMLDT